MAVYISRNLVLTFAQDGEAHNGNLPILGWHNLVQPSNVSASWSAANFPASNLGNPNTASRWQSDRATTQHVTFDIQSAEPVDYVGIARHNLASIRAIVSVQIQRSGQTTWTTVFEERILPTDGPAILRFEPQPVDGVRLRIEAAEAPPSIAVAYVGKLLVMERGLQQGHVPAHLASQDEIVTGLAESGDYLGRVVTQRALSTGVSFRYLRKTWFDANMLPFTRIARERPFFFAWMPQDYPDEAAFCWTTSDLRPEAEMLASGVHMHLDFQMSALVR